ncbi:MAG TPA: thioredoxin domain-containing protein, partial [Actinomycetota bacterium]|nr:thioredoxin domain-containing protein [Actinomycetota bacterium]
VSAEDHVIGAPDAGITLVEYGEFECPHCGRAHFQLKELRKRLPELGARIVFRHLARDDVHPFSVRAAVTAEAAARQGGFWEMHDHLFENQHALEYDDLRSHAAAVGLDVSQFMEDLFDVSLLDRVHADGARAVEAGVVATPTFFLNGRVYDGSYSSAALASAIKREESAG